MLEVKRLVRNLSFDGWLLGFTGLAAVAIGMLDFIGWLQLSTEQLLQMVIVGLGLLMGAVVVQVTRQETSVDRIRTQLGAADIEVLDMKWAFPQHIAQRAREAQKFILDTNLNEEVPRFPRPSSPQAQYRRIRDERVSKDEIGFRRVEVIFRKKHLESVVRRLLTFEGHEFYLRHYDPPPQAIPVLHIMSFDGEHFYLGGFYPTESPTEEQAVYIRNMAMNQLLHDYWQMLWLRARPVNEGTVINWVELKRIGKRLGMTDEEFSEMVNRVKGEVQEQPVA